MEKKAIVEISLSAPSGETPPGELSKREWSKIYYKMTSGMLFYTTHKSRKLLLAIICRALS